MRSCAHMGPARYTEAARTHWLHLLHTQSVMAHMGGLARACCKPCLHLVVCAPLPPFSMGCRVLSLRSEPGEKTCPAPQLLHTRLQVHVQVHVATTPHHPSDVLCKRIPPSPHYTAVCWSHSRQEQQKHPAEEYAGLRHWHLLLVPAGVSSSSRCSVAAAGGMTCAH